MGTQPMRTVLTLVLVASLLLAGLLVSVGT